MRFCSYFLYLHGFLLTLFYFITVKFLIFLNVSNLIQLHVLKISIIKLWALDSKIRNQPFFWYSKISFWFWRCDFILSRISKLKDMYKVMQFPPFLISLCFLTLRRPKFFIFTVVNFSSQNVFWMYQPW